MDNLNYFREVLPRKLRKDEIQPKADDFIIRAVSKRQKRLLSAFHYRIFAENCQMTISSQQLLEF